MSASAVVMATGRYKTLITAVNYGRGPVVLTDHGQFARELNAAGLQAIQVHPGR